MYAGKLDRVRLCVRALAADLHSVGFVHRCAYAYTELFLGSSGRLA